MKLTLKQAKNMMEQNGGSLCLRGTKITALPDNLTVGGNLDLRGTKITDKFEAERRVRRLRNGDKERYSIREVIELTRGQYGAEAFEAFFEMEESR